MDSPSPDDDARAGDRARRSDDANWRTASSPSSSPEPDTTLARTAGRAPRAAAWLSHAKSPTGEWNGRSARVDKRSTEADPRPDDVNFPTDDMDCRTDRADGRTVHRAEEIPEMA